MSLPGATLALCCFAVVDGVVKGGTSSVLSGDDEIIASCDANGSAGADGDNTKTTFTPEERAAAKRSAQQARAVLTPSQPASAVGQPRLLQHTSDSQSSRPDVSTPRRRLRQHLSDSRDSLADVPHTSDSLAAVPEYPEPVAGPSQPHHQLGHPGTLLERMKVKKHEWMPLESRLSKFVHVPGLVDQDVISKVPSAFSKANFECVAGVDVDQSGYHTSVVAAHHVKHLLSAWPYRAIGAFPRRGRAPLLRFLADCNRSTVFTDTDCSWLNDPPMVAILPTDKLDLLGDKCEPEFMSSLRSIVFRKAYLLSRAEVFLANDTSWRTDSMLADLRIGRRRMVLFQPSTLTSEEEGDKVKYTSPFLSCTAQQFEKWLDKESSPPSARTQMFGCVSDDDVRTAYDSRIPSSRHLLLRALLDTCPMMPPKKDIRLPPGFVDNTMMLSKGGMVPIREAAAVNGSGLLKAASVLVDPDRFVIELPPREDPPSTPRNLKVLLWPGDAVSWILAVKAAQEGLKVSFQPSGTAYGDGGEVLRRRGVEVLRRLRQNHWNIPTFGEIGRLANSFRVRAIWFSCFKDFCDSWFVAPTYAESPSVSGGQTPPPNFQLVGVGGKDMLERCAFFYSILKGRVGPKKAPETVPVTETVGVESLSFPVAETDLAT